MITGIDMPYLRPTNVLVAVVVVYSKIITVTSQKCNLSNLQGFVLISSVRIFQRLQSNTIIQT